jgi:NAD-dependent SIR2 family protein deacetylase
MDGYAPDCPDCADASVRRARKGKRPITVGRLRPDIVFYGEADSRTADIISMAQHDRSLKPRLLLILGTSLSTYGVKSLVRDFARTVHDSGGVVVMVNRTQPASSTWDRFIDYWVEWDCDAWVRNRMLQQPLPSKTTELVRAGHATDGRGLDENGSGGSNGALLGSREWPIDLTFD